jgi:uncharacterized phage-associated protein
MIQFNFNQEKAIATLLFISKRLIERKGPFGADLHKVFKIMYFSDQKHLARYGRPIMGDYYIAMTHGGVPSRVYDMIKIVRGDSLCPNAMGFDRFFELLGKHFIGPKQDPDMDEFSASDLECLEESLKENQDLGFPELVRKSHDQAYNKAAKDDKISYREMAKALGAKESILNFMKLQSENEGPLMA